ncbi:tetratricopeptide repeat protein [uncultured Desulfobacter sp.]|uniref:tetratricopeptide repeat protein n=1 Tax=uncultured Desulfobacter sp. TaxID=240139 RepID=UPI002AAAC231|nr:tetratricopeptide repeat protein [uncultured Desulfobacter sp.]
MEKYMASAGAYMDAKEYNNAEIELKNVLQINPRNEQAYIKLSEIYRILGKPDKEIKVLLQAVTLNPDNMEAQFRLGQVYLLGRQTKNARETAQLILSKEPCSIRAYHMLATAQVQERNPAAAVKTLNKAIELAPDNPHLYFFLGFLEYYQNKNFQNAEAAYLKGISIDNTLLEGYQELSEIYIREKQLDKAENLLIDLTKLEKNRVPHLAVLAEYYENRNQLDKAEKVYLAIIDASDPGDYRPVYNLAVFHAQHKNFDAAVTCLKQAMALSDAMVIHEALAKTYLELKKFNDAKEQAGWILEKESGNSTGRLVIIQIQMADQDYGKAFENLEELISIDKDNAFAYYLQAVCLMEKKLKKLPAQEIKMAASGDASVRVWRRNLAIESLKTAINISPDFAIARLMLADIYLQNQETNLADKQIDYILDHVPTDFRAFLMRGKIKMMQEQWGAAKQVFQTITQRVPAYSPAYVQLGIIYNAQNRTEQAIKEFQTALSCDPLNMDAMRYLVNTYMSHGRKEEALTLLKRHFDRPELTSFERGFIKFLLGKIALGDNDVDLAKKYFNSSIQIHKETTPTYEALAKISEVHKDWDDAIKYNETILSYNPEYIPAFMNLNRIYQLKKETEKARDVLKKVLEIKEDHAIAANELAYILANEGGQMQRALSLARIAEAKYPDNPYVLDTLGWVYYKQKAYDLAINKLEESLKMAPDNPITNYHLGWAYYDTGRYEQARQCMKKALKLNPDFEGARRAREIIGE